MAAHQAACAAWLLEDPGGGGDEEVEAAGSTAAGAGATAAGAGAMGSPTPEIDRPWALLQHYAGGVSGETAFAWEPPPVPKHQCSWNESLYGAAPMDDPSMRAAPLDLMIPRSPQLEAPAPPRSFANFREFKCSLTPKGASHNRTRPMLFVGGLHRSGTSVRAPAYLFFGAARSRRARNFRSSRAS